MAREGLPNITVNTQDRAIVVKAKTSLDPVSFEISAIEFFTPSSLPFSALLFWNRMEQETADPDFSGDQRRFVRHPLCLDLGFERDQIPFKRGQKQ